jgi:hypothetical protein
MFVEKELNMKDKVVHMLEVLDRLSEGLYEICNTTREQQILALKGVLDRVKERDVKEQVEITKILESVESIQRIGT